jgi:hypothetical protein
MAAAMITKVLHGEGKPRIILKETELLSATIAAITDVTTVETTGVITFDESSLNMMVYTKNAADEETKGKIILYSPEANIIKVDQWDNFIPAVGKAISIKNRAIDLPYSQGNLIETFKIDATKKTYYSTGAIKVKINGFYYSVLLDYSRYADLDLLPSMQSVYDSARTDSFTFYPRRDNPAVYYECEIDPETDFNLAQLPRHQGMKLVQFRFICLKRLSKIDLTSSLKSVLGPQTIIMSDTLVTDVAE